MYNMCMCMWFMSELCVSIWILSSILIIILSLQYSIQYFIQYSIPRVGGGAPRIIAAGPDPDPQRTQESNNPFGQTLHSDVGSM